MLLTWSPAQVKSLPVRSPQFGSAWNKNLWTNRSTNTQVYPQKEMGISTGIILEMETVYFHIISSSAPRNHWQLVTKKDRYVPEVNILCIVHITYVFFRLSNFYFYFYIFGHAPIHWGHIFKYMMSFCKPNLQFIKKKN